MALPRQAATSISRRSRVDARAVDISRIRASLARYYIYFLPRYITLTAAYFSASFAATMKVAVCGVGGDILFNAQCGRSFFWAAVTVALTQCQDAMARAFGN